MNRGLALLLLGVWPLGAPAADVSTSEYRDSDGARVVVQELVVDGTLDEVWQAFTTKEGWEGWAVPFAHIDFRIGGIIETSYDPAAKHGDEDNIRSRILSFLPYQMLSVQAIHAPPDFPHAGLLPSLHSVFEFERVDDERTRVRISGVGYRDGEGYDQLLEFFREGNAWTLKRLGKRLEQGPLEWAATPPHPDPEPANNNSKNKRD
jgi:uncharacterized protein YndB with AHSA1/START domain